VTFADHLAARLDRRPAVGGVEVVGWRFDLSDSRAIRAGLKDSRIGGPYDPPSVAASIGGGIFVVWSDGLYTYGNVDAQAVEAFEARLRAWRESAFADPYAPPLLPPASYPAVETFDPRVAAIVDGDTELLFRLLQRALETCRAAGARIVDAGVGAGVGTRCLCSSTGIWVSYQETSFSYWASADDLYSRGYSKRRVIDEPEAEDLIQDVAMTSAALRSEAPPLTGQLPVVLPPDEAESFYSHYLGANLAGSAVVNGHAAFTLDDFKNGKQVARSDLDLWVDTLLPLEGAATPATSEGVPGGRTDLITAGRLVTPLLDLKYARRAGMAPTPLPRGGPAFLLRSRRDDLAPADLLADVERGLYVYSLLGMHTQDASSGSYSLVAPQARAILDGQLLDGKVKAVLAGNFFEHLRDERTRFARFPFEWNPGLRVHCTVSAGD